MQIINNHSLLARFINNRWFQHISYWVLFVLFFAFAWGTHDNDYILTLKVELINLPVKIILVYFVIYFLFPKYLYQEKLWTFIPLFVLSLFVAAALQRITDNLIIVDVFFPEWGKVPTFNFVQIVRSAVNTSSVLAIPMTVKLMEYISSVQQRQQILAKDKLEAELTFLKNQVQPHFLFNTLNSLYSLILKKSDQSLEVVLKLSDLLRYMLYETNAAQVQLHKEIESIKSYLELEKIRYGKRVELSLNIWGEQTGQAIAPMLILPFLENSFKHSTRGFNGQAWITIEMGIKENDFVLKVENSMPEEITESPAASGIGLQNVKRRLNLMYPNNHELKIESSTDSHQVVLKLKLKEQL
ncbi:sensor histidine kinase [Carboxylicivirga marina]|uniref:Histidine kinase n=1 Tax=Carboxylicivirga marina TaxID=2800988 RepID=A0ABS1HIF3_9BACT|nr:histidine kinase [Carboxylicivirga marina]MBK3517448.1 histidine kinase [Carboxylicivirga marina]